MEHDGNLENDVTNDAISCLSMRTDSNKDSFERVYDAFFPVLMRIAYHITGNMNVSEDLCQEAFIKYYQRTVPFPDTDQAKYWLIRVLKNLAYNFEKRKRREKKAFTKVLQQPQRTEPSGESETLKKEAQNVVQRALQNIPYKFRSVLVLKEYGQLSYKEIARILGITEGNVKVRVFRARECLENLIKGGDYVP